MGNVRYVDARSNPIPADTGILLVDTSAFRQEHGDSIEQFSKSPRAQVYYFDYIPDEVRDLKWKYRGDRNVRELIDAFESFEYARRGRILQKRTLYQDHIDLVTLLSGITSKYLAVHALQPSLELMNGELTAVTLVLSEQDSQQVRSIFLSRNYPLRKRVLERLCRDYETLHKTKRPLTEIRGQVRRNFLPTLEEGLAKIRQDLRVVFDESKFYTERRSPVHKCFQDDVDELLTSYFAGLLKGHSIQSVNSSLLHDFSPSKNDIALVVGSRKLAEKGDVVIYASDCDIEELHYAYNLIKRKPTSGIRVPSS